ncbi:MAG: glycoside hydrolase family 18 protein [Actinobacteria bacterium]|nr:glycoside hydrolase family 18 protein [Actinomycetota bacterium]
MDHRRGTAMLFGLVAVVLCAGVTSAVNRHGSAAGPEPTIAPASAVPSPSRWFLDRGFEAVAPVPSSSTTTSTPPPAGPDVSAYRGLGAWMDAFDYAPAYHRPREGPLLVPDDIDAMAARGVGTLFLQAARLDDRSPEGIVDPALVATFLKRAHERGMHVVGWYLPKFADVEADLANLRRIRDLDVDGHRFDGIAVDIEYRRDVPDHAERNRRMLELSRRFREEARGRPLGAIVYPPVLFEEIRPDFWPDFPWKELAPSFDVWLPMAYWTEIAAESSYGDGYRYTEAGIRHLLDSLGDPSALVHPVGGVADTSTVDDYEGFVRAVEETGALGFSMYDYRTTSPAGWRLLTARGPDPA